MAENNIILEFTGDTSGIKTTIQDIQKLGTTTDAMVANFNAKTKTSEQEVNKLGQAIKNIPKVIVDKGVNDATTAYKKLNDEVKKTTDVHVSLRTQIAKVREELAALGTRNKENAAQYDELIRKGGELKERYIQIQGALATVGRQTKTFDGLISIARGATGAFAGLTAAQALFGDENKDLQASMLKVLATLELLNAVREIAELLEEKSAAFQLVRTIQTKLFTTAKVEQTAATIANTVATEAEVGATESATVATEELSAAMEISPAFIILAAITALGAALYVLTDNTNAAAEKTKRLNEQLMIQLELLKAQAEGRNKDAELFNAKLDADISRLKLRGATIEEIDALEKKQLAEVTKAYEENIAALDKKFAFQENGTKRMSDLEKGVFIQNQIQNGKTEEQAKEALQARENSIRDITNSERALADAKAKLADIQESIDESTYKKMSEKKRKSTQELLKNEEAYQKAIIETIETAQNNINKIEKETADLKRSDKIDDLNRTKALYAAQLLEAKNASDQKLSIQLSEIETERKLDEASNSYTEAEKAKGGLLDQKYATLHRDAQEKNQQEQIQDARKLNDAIIAENRLMLEQKLKDELAGIQLERTQILTNRKLNDTERLTANIELDNKERAAILKSNVDQSQLKLTLDKARFQQEDALALQGNEKKYQHEKKLLDDEEKLEYDQLIITNSIENAKLISHSNRIAKEEQLDRDHALFQIEQQTKQLAADQQHELAVLALQKNTGSGIGAQIQNAVIAKQESDIRIKAFQQEMELDKKKFEAKGESEQDFLNNQRKLQDEIAAQRAASDRDIAKTSIEIAKQGLDSIVSNWQAANDQYYEARIQTLERAKDAELNMDNVSNVQKAAIRNKYAKEEAALKLQQWKADQQAKEISAVINTALAITNAFATAPWPVDIIQAALAAATGVAQIAIIASQKPPAFATGTADAPPGFKLVGERGPELMWTPGHERIITHAESMQIMHKYNIPAFSAPTLSDTTMGDLSKGFEFDYNKFGDVMAKKLKDNPQLVVNIDKHGLDTYIKSSMGRSKLLENRIRM